MCAGLGREDLIGDCDYAIVRKHFDRGAIDEDLQADAAINWIKVGDMAACKVRVEACITGVCAVALALLNPAVDDDDEEICCCFC